MTVTLASGRAHYAVVVDSLVHSWRPPRRGEMREAGSRLTPPQLGDRRTGGLTGVGDGLAAGELSCLISERLISPDGARSRGCFRVGVPPSIALCRGGPDQGVPCP